MRRLSILASVLAVVAVLGADAAVTAAQEATPAAAPPVLPPPLAAWAAAFAAFDVEGILAAYTDDAVFEEVPLNIVAHGQDELRAYLEAVKAAFPDVSLVVISGFVAGDRAAAEFTLTATYRGQFPGFPPGAGQNIAIRGASVLELEGDKIRADREYWDASAFLVAIGALMPPGAPGPSAATPAP
jgi:steroid delta-isomerase-like uncharacterized protein